MTDVRREQPVRRPRATRGQAIAGAPGFAQLKTGYETVAIAVKTVLILIRPPFTWVADAVVQSSELIKRCLFPLALSQMIWLTGFGVLNFGEVAYGLGVVDRDPGGVYTGYVREVATWITLMIFAGVAGSAMAADLGARKVREELDAMSVLGVDTIRSLVAPRVAAMTFCSVVLGLLGLLIAMITNYSFAPPFLGFSHGVYRQSMYLSIEPIDLYSSMLKHAIMGFFLGVVACQKGLSAKGGTEGVGRAVTQTVIISFVGIWALNSVYNLGFVTLFPDASAIRG